MRTTAIAVLAVAVLAGPALADWDTGQPDKMHYPQLPDPEGWDVRINNARRQPGEPPQWIVADDWRCTGTGPVSDVHLWVSWRWDMPDQILNIHLSIHDDIPAAVSPTGYSTPGDLLWEFDSGPALFTIWPVAAGDQGWFDPPFEEWEYPDHHAYHQINIVDIPDPFIQEEGKIYWLDVSVDLWGEGETGMIGWKTSLDHWNDDAVYWDIINQTWLELRDPRDPDKSLDMAFVITPEPASLVLLGAGLGALVARRTTHRLRRR